MAFSVTNKESKRNYAIQLFLFFGLTFFNFLLTIAVVLSAIINRNGLTVIYSIVMVTNVIIFGKLFLGVYDASKEFNKNVSKEENKGREGEDKRKIESNPSREIKRSDVEDSKKQQTSTQEEGRENLPNNGREQDCKEINRERNESGSNEHSEERRY